MVDKEILSLSKYVKKQNQSLCEWGYNENLHEDWLCGQVSIWRVGTRILQQSIKDFNFPLFKDRGPNFNFNFKENGQNKESNPYWSPKSVDRKIEITLQNALRLLIHLNNFCDLILSSITLW